MNCACSRSSAACYRGRRLRLRQASESEERYPPRTSSRRRGLRGEASAGSIQHRKRKVKKPKADSGVVSSARALSGQSGDRKRKRARATRTAIASARVARANLEVGSRARGWRAGDGEDKRKAGREGGKTSGLARGAAARRRRGQDGAANIAATGSCSISRYSSVNHRVEKATGMRLLSQATQLRIDAL
jgi:hypothetical protein